jgi:acyl carrier protein
LALRQSASLAEFLNTLDLRVSMQPAIPDHILRVSQLSQRTNQFNASGLIFTSLELKLLMQQGHKVMTVEVSDRFGEYGMVGAVMFCEQQESITVEAFYLSCRVLGRGVEHRVLSELARIAQASGLHYLRIYYNQSHRNQPFRRFLNGLPGQLVVNASGPCTFVLSANDALEARVIRDADPVVAVPEQGAVMQDRPVTVRSHAAVSRLPYEFLTAAQILSHLETSTSTQREFRVVAPFVPPQAGLESAVAEEWAAILRMDKVGRNDNFFDLGGNSLLLVQLNGNLISRLNNDISVTEMFQYPTVASLAAHIAGRTLPDSSHQTCARGAMVRAALQERRQQILARQP